LLRGYLCGNDCHKRRRGVCHASDVPAEGLIALSPTLDETAKQQIRDIDERHPLNPRADLRW
ncbi:MAG: hypothetical protein R6U98_26440, partial [Pirellulaceae bacterium]